MDGWEFFVDVIFSTMHALRVFWKVLPRAIGPGFTLQGRYPARALTLLCGKMRTFVKKKGDLNKKFRRGRGYLQIVQERCGVVHSCLSTLGDKHKGFYYLFAGVTTTTVLISS